jgi:hypothetical protein
VATGNGQGKAPAPAVPTGGGSDKPGFSVGGIFRRRKDGLQKDSGAAKVVDTEAERIRKAVYRASKKQAESVPALPPPLAKPGQPAPPAGGQVPTVPGSAPVNGLAAVPAEPGEAVAPFVLWTGPDLTPITDTAVPLMEEVLHTAKLNKLRAAKVNPDTIKQIEKDFDWPEKSKSTLSKTGAALGAKYLNKVGVSAVYKDEVNFGMALLLILKMEASTNAKLDKLIAAAEKAAGPANSAPAGPGHQTPAAAAVPIPAPAAPANAPAVVMAGGGLFPTDVPPDAAKPTTKR